MRGRVSLWLMVSLGCAAIVLALIPESREWLHSTGRLHVWYHVGLFAVLGGLTMRLSRDPDKRFFLMVLCFALGFGIEWVEAAQFHGDVEWTDVEVDAGGVLLGSVLGWVVSRRGIKQDG